MNDNDINCSNLFKSTSSFKAILDDIEKFYDHVGGEISAIESPSSNTYVVSILQEGRVDRLTYSLKISEECKVEILDRKEEAIDPRNLNN